MTAMQLANVLQFVVVAILWAILLFGLIPYARLDGFRQEMFAIRDELFDYAADGNIAFDHPAYMLLRKQMNGLIRYGHQLTVFRFSMTVISHKVAGRPANTQWLHEWQKAIDSIEDERVRKGLGDFHDRAMGLAFGRLLAGSPVHWILTLLFMVQGVAQGAAKGIGQVAQIAASKAFTWPINNMLIEEAAQGKFA